jgi:hypothetical protein
LDLLNVSTPEVITISALGPVTPDREPPAGPAEKVINGCLDGLPPGTRLNSVAYMSQNL